MSFRKKIFNCDVCFWPLILIIAVEERKPKICVSYPLFLGEKLQFHVVRTAPGLGNVTVEWKIVGHNVKQNFENYSGILFFPEVSP